MAPRPGRGIARQPTLLEGMRLARHEPRLRAHLANGGLDGHPGGAIQRDLAAAHTPTRNIAARGRDRGCWCGLACLRDAAPPAVGGQATVASDRGGAQADGRSAAKEHRRARRRRLCRRCRASAPERLARTRMRDGRSSPSTLVDDCHCAESEHKPNGYSWGGVSADPLGTSVAHGLISAPPEHCNGWGGGLGQTQQAIKEG